MVAALFVETGGSYFGLRTIQPWDVYHDARRYSGPFPVVAHPPCERWSRLAPLVQSRWGHRLGDDGGTFRAALMAVRRYGGVLEHPAYSYAWTHFGLPRPDPHGGWTGSDDLGWSCQVDQGHYGHKARKPTWLYVKHAKYLPRLKRGPSNAKLRIRSWDSRQKRIVNMPHELNKRERSSTPRRFRDILIKIAKSCSPI